VNRGAWQPHVVEVVVNQIGLALGIDKYQGAGRRHREKKVVKALLLFIFFGVDDLL
jgi:hypothetical protein